MPVAKTIPTVNAITSKSTTGKPVQGVLSGIIQNKQKSHESRNKNKHNNSSLNNTTMPESKTSKILITGTKPGVTNSIKVSLSNTTGDLNEIGSRDISASTLRVESNHNDITGGISTLGGLLTDTNNSLDTSKKMTSDVNSTDKVANPVKSNIINRNAGNVGALKSGW